MNPYGSNLVLRTWKHVKRSHAIMLALTVVAPEISG
jgi:hypothetical protein